MIMTNDKRERLTIDLTCVAQRVVQLDSFFDFKIYFSSFI